SNCNELGSNYTGATLLDMIQVGAAPGTIGPMPPNVEYFTVVGDTSNAFALDHPNGTGTGLEINSLADNTQTAQVACVHRTAPLRFTRTNFAKTANLDQACATASGLKYIAASPSDQVFYRFVQVPTAGVLNALPC